jgi:sirohydrochlorin cobaltochelatase
MMEHTADRGQQGLLLLGHGTRDEQGRVEFLEFAESVARAADVPVEAAFLEFCEPTIEVSVGRLVERGARSIRAVPVLLFAAGHAKRDIPRALAAAASRHGGLEIVERPVLGCHPRLLELSKLRFDERLAASDEVIVADEVFLAFLGRGSTDPDANAELARFARLRWEASRCGWIETAYLAMTEPSLPRVLDLAERDTWRTIVVQPHLLFPGLLLDRARDEITRRQTASPHKRWLMTAPLGSHELLVSAVLGLDCAKP